MAATEALIEKINALPAQRVAEVEDFVDFIRLRDHDRALVRSAAEMERRATNPSTFPRDDQLKDRVAPKVGESLSILEALLLNRGQA